MSFPFSVRSPQWLRSKWWALKKHVPESETTAFQGMYLLSITLNIWLVASEYFFMALSQSSGNLLMQPPTCYKIWPYLRVDLIKADGGFVACEFTSRLSGLGSTRTQ